MNFRLAEYQDIYIWGCSGYCLLFYAGIYRVFIDVGSFISVKTKPGFLFVSEIVLTGNKSNTLNYFTGWPIENWCWKVIGVAKLDFPPIKGMIVVVLVFNGIG